MSQCLSTKAGQVQDDRIADLGARLRCRECDERGKVVVGVKVET